MNSPSLPVDLEPVAHAVGPFARLDFLGAVTSVDGVGELRLVRSDSGAIAVVVEDGVVRMAGHADLCDYHSPVGSRIPELVSRLALEVGGGHRFDFDSLPLEAAEVIAKGLELAGLSTDTTEHSAAAVLSLPETFDGYLHAIGKKQRHEIRRKHRRYEEIVGPVVFETLDDPSALEWFVRLHRSAGGEKGDFMDDSMAGYFGELLRLPGWRIDALLHPDGSQPTAMLFGFADEHGYYLYNSAYDPDLRDASPCNVVLSEAISVAIDAGLRRFDFLKGEEDYKFRLGARRRPLYRVVGS